MGLGSAASCGAVETGRRGLPWCRLQATQASDASNITRATLGPCGAQMTMLCRNLTYRPPGRRLLAFEEGKLMLRISMVSVFTMASLVSGAALAQGQALPPVKVNLPPSPSFNVSSAPVQYPTGELSVFGLRKQKDKYMDKDVRVKAYLTEVYECPAELRKCNDALFEKQKAEKKKAMKKGGDALTAPVVVDRTGCRPCDQPHFSSRTARGPSASAPCWWPTTPSRTGTPATSSR